MFFNGQRTVKRESVPGLFGRTLATPRWSDIDLEWTPEQTATPPDGRPEVAADPNGPAIFTAIREQLGVKLDSATGPVDVVVIDSLDTLTPN